MSEINEINIPNVVIPKFGTNEVWLNGVPFVPSNHPSVTTQIGFPIVEIPGCVKMHKDNQDKVTRMPFDHDLVNQDEDGKHIHHLLALAMTKSFALYSMEKAGDCLLYTSPSPRDS